MAKNVYYNGKLIPVKDWDYETKRPKEKKLVKKAEVVTEPETQAEGIATVEIFEEQIID
jgi:hypothetical protein